MSQGYAAIGLQNLKTPANVGNVLRAAKCYGASLVVIAGKRQVKSNTDTTKAWRHMPVMRIDNLKSAIPYGCQSIAVDLVDGAETLVDFVHPPRAFYIFGPEDGTLGNDTLDWCPHKIMVPTLHCMNLAAAVNVILYDRLAKLGPQS